MTIKENVERILKELPEGVRLVGAAKTRSTEEILEAIEAGLEMVGQNYVQEAERAFEVLGDQVSWHMIGHLQSNKAKKAVKIFDMIETIDTLKLAKAVNKVCENIGKVMPILIEINSGGEPQKAGVLPADAPNLVRQVTALSHVKIMGLMTMGPFAGDPEEARPYFRETKKIFEELQGSPLPGVEMRYLSMGMSNSYRIAIEEGANLVRIGTMIFGERD